MRRREFIAFLGGAAVAWPLAMRAQQSSKMKPIAIVSPATKIGDMSVSGYRIYRVFFEELSRLGYVEGQNLVVERYSGEGRSERYADLARDVVSTHLDLIFTLGPLALNLKMPTTTIPIVAITADPVVGGLVPSLARPGGNMTGVSTDAGLELHGKRLALLAEAIPKLSNARYLAAQPGWAGPYGAVVREVARRAGISLAGALLGSPINEVGTSASLIRWSRIEWMRLWWPMNPRTSLIVGCSSNWRRKAAFPQFIRSASTSNSAG
jgi:putative ABC transport system substrate-binding protein